MLNEADHGFNHVICNVKKNSQNIVKHSYSTPGQRSQQNKTKSSEASPPEKLPPGETSVTKTTDTSTTSVSGHGDTNTTDSAGANQEAGGEGQEQQHEQQEEAPQEEAEGFAAQQEAAEEVEPKDESQQEGESQHVDASQVGETQPEVKDEEPAVAMVIEPRAKEEGVDQEEIAMKESDSTFKGVLAEQKEEPMETDDAEGAGGDSGSVADSGESLVFKHPLSSLYQPSSLSVLIEIMSAILKCVSCYRIEIVEYTKQGSNLALIL